MKYSRLLNQKALYWPPGSPDGFGGMTFGDPSEIPCRWEEKMIQYLSRTGETKISRAIVFVDQDLIPGGYLYLGSRTDLESHLPSAFEPTDLPNAWEIQSFTRIPGISAQQFTRSAIL